MQKGRADIKAEELRAATFDRFFATARCDVGTMQITKQLSHNLLLISSKVNGVGLGH